MNEPKPCAIFEGLLSGNCATASASIVGDSFGPLLERGKLPGIHSSIVLLT